GRGFDPDVLATLEGWVQDGLQPDLTIWFDLPAAVAAERRAAARSPDRFESQDTLFFERVRAGYEARRAQDPGRFLRLDAALTREAVWAELVAGLEARGW
ncbi:MAG: dTMP kinase, partial [Rhizobacter sp.]